MTRKLTHVTLDINEQDRAPRLSIYMRYDDGHEESGDFGDGLPGPWTTADPVPVTTGAYLPSVSSFEIFGGDPPNSEGGYYRVLELCDLIELPDFEDAVVPKDARTLFIDVIRRQHGPVRARWMELHIEALTEAGNYIDLTDPGWSDWSQIPDDLELEDVEEVWERTCFPPDEDNSYEYYCDYAYEDDGSDIL